MDKKARSLIIKLFLVPVISADDISYLKSTQGVGLKGGTYTEVLEFDDTNLDEINEREIITIVPQNSEDGDETEETINLNKPSITGATIGTLLTSSNLMFIVTMICITFIVFLVVTSRTIIKTSENK